jgi:hypothetical protein
LANLPFKCQSTAIKLPAFGFRARLEVVINGAELARRGIDCDPRGVDVMLAQLEAEERVQS